ncbi:HPr kinase/phosphorylase [Sphingomonas quercus]|uniref:HPr kinase/phosphatase C-terminal domain-containing protein n=1 Tax=Sphingomonas quercus TaxID=2842451 RepID=A0ABS6BFI6_9SPHN|nr:HPr kinase/phosphatase C-terminal domain-containing protein [Sphingomonas quercus]MBU3076601.1 HPr kinase/phosphatase C-terminal domain-containing protein [Sphingomonas quercus]
MSGTIHASCVAIGGWGVLLAGESGRGKSDLALRLIDRGAELVSDDYTLIAAEGDRLVARAPRTIAGRIEVRGLGIIAMPSRPEAAVALLVDLGEAPVRMPDEGETRLLAGIAVPLVRLAALEASAPLKVELALAHLGRHGA